ncbi:MAG: hypothetical protein GY739_09025, partial [Mesoflavibacter sp.]|nr:hypothetical protein [Mesoflavibacter sp.]
SAVDQTMVAMAAVTPTEETSSAPPSASASQDTVVAGAPVVAPAGEQLEDEEAILGQITDDETDEWVKIDENEANALLELPDATTQTSGLKGSSRSSQMDVSEPPTNGESDYVLVDEWNEEEDDRQLEEAEDGLADDISVIEEPERLRIMDPVDETVQTQAELAELIEEISLEPQQELERRAREVGMDVETFQQSRNYQLTRAEKLAKLKEDLTRTYDWNNTNPETPGYYEESAEMISADANAIVLGATAVGKIGRGIKSDPNRLKTLINLQPPIADPSEPDAPVQQRPRILHSLSTSMAATYASTRHVDGIVITNNYLHRPDMNNFGPRFRPQDVPGAAEINPIVYYKTENERREASKAYLRTVSTKSLKNYNACLETPTEAHPRQAPVDANIDDSLIVDFELDVKRMYFRSTIVKDSVATKEMETHFRHAEKVGKRVDRLIYNDNYKIEMSSYQQAQMAPMSLTTNDLGYLVAHGRQYITSLRFMGDREEASKYDVSRQMEKVPVMT